MAVVMFASIVAISIGTNMKADAQNPTTSEEAAKSDDKYDKYDRLIL